MTYQPTLRQRLADARNVPARNNPLPPIPSRDEISPDQHALLNEVAHKARFGDTVARGHLYESMLPHLIRLSWFLRQSPNSATHTAVWDRDDVAQETWLTFHHLLMEWDEHLHFATYLLSTFTFALKNRVLRGVARGVVPFGIARVPDTVLFDVLTAADSDRPDRALVAKETLDEMAPDWLQLLTTGSLDDANLATSPGERGKLRALASVHHVSNWVPAYDIGQGRTA